MSPPKGFLYIFAADHLMRSPPLGVLEEPRTRLLPPHIKTADRLSQQRLEVGKRIHPPRLAATLLGLPLSLLHPGRGILPLVPVLVSSTPHSLEGKGVGAEARVTLRSKNSLIE